MPKKGANQTPIERNFAILIYLKKFEGKNDDWKNKNEIAHYYPGHSLGRGRMEPILDGFVEKGFIEKRNAENPQAKIEYKITEKGKIYLKKLSIVFSDSDMKHLAGIKTDKLDDLI